MKTMSSWFSLTSAILSATLLTLLPGAATAQGWPSKPIRIVVPYPPGGSSDIIARAISQPLAQALGQSGSTSPTRAAHRRLVTRWPVMATLPQVEAGKLRVLGVSKATRMPLLRDVPTIAEQGLPGFESGTWQGLLAPSSMPAAAMARLTAEVTRIIRSPEVRERLVSQGAEVHTMSPADFTVFFDRERKAWAKVVAQGGVKID